MINSLTAFFSRFIMGSAATNNSKDTAKVAPADATTSAVFSTNAYRGSDVIPKSLSPKIVAQNEMIPDWELSQDVKRTLDKIFKGSSYSSVDDLPIYPVDPNDNYIERDKMEASVMKGIINGHRFIIIKLDANLSTEYIQKYYPVATEEVLARNQKIEGTLFLYQYRGDKDFVWGGGKGSGPHRPKFFTKNFIVSEDGALSNGQERNFNAVRTLIKKGASQDLRGLIWKISEK